jgi:HK97 family phage portal protein
MKLLDALAKVWAESRGFHVSQEPPGWIKALGGWDTSAGVDVSPERALQVTTVFACVRILAETLASLPLHLYKRLSNDAKERAREHPLYSILHDLPNPEMTAFEFRETLMGHVATWGNGYSEIQLNKGGQVMELWPLRPDKMKIERRDGELWYTYRLPKPDKFGRTEVILRKEQLLHVHGLGFDGIQEYNPIRLARDAVGLAMATEGYGGRFFKNGASPGGVLEHPGTLSPEAHKNLRESWEEQHKGLDRSSRLAILEEGMKYNQIGLPPETAQFLQTRKFQVSEIARFYRVPPHMVADLDRATFSNIEHQGLEFVMYTMMPWMVRWEQAIGRDLLGTAERRQYFAGFLVDALLRGDIKSRYEAYAVARQNGWMNADEIRARENLNPMPDGQGQIYLVPLNMVPADQVGLEPSWDQPPSGDDGEGRGYFPGNSAQDGRSEERARRSARGRHRLMLAHMRVYRDVAARIVRREVNDVRNAAAKFFKRRDAQSFTLWLGEFYREHVEFVAQQMMPLARSYGELVAAEAQGEIGESQEMTPRLESFVTAYVGGYAARHASISEGRIRGTVQEALEANEDPLEALEADLETWEEKRSDEISRWEAVRFGSALAVMVYLIGGILRLRWVAFGDTCPYCRDLDGKVVGIKQFFLPAGSDYEPDGAERPLHVSHNVGHPPAHHGCDCMVAAA